MHDHFSGMHADLQAEWERVEGHLRAVVGEVDLASTSRAEVEEFLDHNELGVAFEWIVSILAGLGPAVSDTARRHLAAAAREMQLEDNTDWQRLQPRG